MEKQIAPAPKKRSVAYVLWLLFGWFGFHRFYLRRFKSGIVMLLLTISLIIYNFADIRYLLFRILWLLREGAGFSIMISGSAVYLSIVLHSSLVFMFIWWLIDSGFIFWATRKKANQNAE